MMWPARIANGAYVPAIEMGTDIGWANRMRGAQPCC